MRAARNAADLTQQEVGERSGLARTNYVAYEHNQVPGPSIMKRIADAVSVHPSALSEVLRSEATLRDLREWAGLSQKEAAAGVKGWKGRVTLSEIERGERPIKEAHAKALARHYGCSLEELNAAAERSQAD